MTDKLVGTCSVCLRPMQLHGDRPIRHGFSAIGVRHGQHSGWHTGPCSGTKFPHLGISSEGTRWALERARERLGGVNDALDKLAGNPDLIWYPQLRGSSNKVRGGLPDLSKPVTLRYGDESVWANDGRPTYAWEHRKRVAEQENLKHELERSIDAYEKVLATWSPEKYPVTGAAKKVETVHMERSITLRGQTVTGVLCKGLRAMRGQRLLKTNDPAKVTCKRCRAHLGLPPL